MNESRPIPYSYPVDSLDEFNSYEGLKRQANAARQRRRDARKAPRVLITRCELVRDFILPAAAVGLGLATLYLIFWCIAQYAKVVLPA